MSQSELIDSHVSLKQCRQAVEALHSHETKKQEKLDETELLPGKQQHIWLNVTVKKIPSGHRFKPFKIPVIHPLVDPRTTSVCLITKDPQREYKDLLEKHDIKFISRVVGLVKLKGKFKPFEARRMLLKENGLFLADERVVPMLPKLLGSKWFEAKKQPIPVCLTRKDLKGELERAISSTYMNQNQGTCTSIKVATLSHKPAQVLANIQTALPAIAKQIFGGWDNIQSLHIKTNSSVSLPIWTCSLDEQEGGRWDGFKVAEESGSEDEEVTEQVAEKPTEAETTKNKGADKGKKRTSENNGNENLAQPTKKQKSAKSTVIPSTSNSKVLQKHSVSTSAIVSPPKLGSTDVDSLSSSKSSKRKVPPPDPSLKSTKKISTATTDTPPTASKAKKHKRDDPVAVSPSLISPTEKIAKEKVKTADVSLKAVTTKTSLTRDDLKQKRDQNLGDKKKEKVIKAKSRKSMKDHVLGRKIAQA